MDSSGSFNSDGDILMDTWPPADVKWYYSDDYTAIAHGDCRKILPKMPKVDLVLTDPPYGMNLNVNFGSMKSKLFKGKTGGNNYSRVIGDDKPFDPSGFLHLSAEQFWFGADYYFNKLPKDGSWLVWDKRLDDSADKMYGSCFELIWSKKKHKRDILRVKFSGIFGMEKQDVKKRIHPTQKPLALMNILIEKYSEVNQLIFDPFMGSGTTLRAAKDLERKAIGIEIEEKYCQIAADRLRQNVLPLGKTKMLNKGIQSSLLD